MSNIEMNLKSMMTSHGAFCPVRSYDFARGIFCLIKDKSMRANKPVGCRLHAWHNVGLADACSADAVDVRNR
jgi:hypothetical protein